MSKLAVHTTVRDARGAVVWLSPGDDVPAWAADQVGDHCLVGGRVVEKKKPGESDAAGKANETGNEASDVDHKKPTDGPDFTKPAPRRGRPRKQG